LEQRIPKRALDLEPIDLGSGRKYGVWAVKRIRINSA
jgi:hypothetical protein